MKITTLLCCVLVSTAVSRQQLAVEEGTKNVNGVVLYYKIIGTGEPILIVHGGPGMDHSYFLPQMSVLAKHYRLIFFDQRDHGRSLTPDSAGMRMDLFIEDIEALRKEFNLGTMNLMGHSWGGLVAAWYGIKYPDNLRTLLLVNSAGVSSDDRTKTNQAILQRSTREDSTERAQVLRSDDFKKGSTNAMRQLLRIAFRPSFYNRTLADSLTLLFPPDYTAKSAALNYLWKDLYIFDLYPQLKNITAPTLILHGDSDSLPLDIAQKLHRSIAGSTMIVLNNSGHFPYIETPDEFVRTIRNFMTSAGSKRND